MAEVQRVLAPEPGSDAPQPPPAAVRRVVKGHPVSGFSALMLLIGGVAVFALARWAGEPAQDGLGARTIQGLYGLLVAGLLGVVILAYAWAHRMAQSVAKPRPAVMRVVEVALAPLGRAFTMFDFFLVFSFANWSGAGPYTAAARATHFIAYFSIALAAAWLSPPPWGLVGVGAALLAILALNRKWSWVEEDRRNYVLSGHYEVRRDSNLGIGFEADYRGVALTALALMIVFMPLALMQMTAFGFFQTKDETPIGEVGVLEWFVFFGGEMAKSVPFVDWSEVYGAETITSIEAVPRGGQDAVFFVRALVDLVLLAGFIQAFELTNRLSRQQANFRDPDNPERILDPFVERDAFRDIAAFVVPERTDRLQLDLISGLWERVGPFRKYSIQQIQRVLMRGEAPEFWRPDHETAMALILPHRDGGGGAPMYFTKLFDKGVVWEMTAQGGADRPVHERTQIGAIIAALGVDGAGFAEARGVALERLPKFLESGDDRVWSAAACALAERADDPAFPAEAPARFAAALAGGAPEKTDLLLAALAHLANARRPTEAELQGRPHLDWAVDVLLDVVRAPGDLDTRARAAETIGKIAFVPGRRLDAAQRALGDFAREAKPHALSWKHLFPGRPEHRARRAALASVAKISEFERGAG